MEYKFSEDKDFSSKLKSFFDLYEGNRRSGRSFLLSRITIELGIETRETMSIIDHAEIYERHSNQRVLQHALHEISKTVEWYKTQGVFIDVKQYSRTQLKFSILRGHEIYNRIRIEQSSIPVPKEQITNSVTNRKLLLIL